MSAMGQLECFMNRSSDLDAIRRVAQLAEAAVEGAGGRDQALAVWRIDHLLDQRIYHRALQAHDIIRAFLVGGRGMPQADEFVAR